MPPASLRRSGELLALLPGVSDLLTGLAGLLDDNLTWGGTADLGATLLPLKEAGELAAGTLTSCCHLRTKFLARLAKSLSCVFFRISLTYLPMRVS